MAENPTTCGNCHAENPPEAEFCAKCGQPLTASAGDSMREQEAAQGQGGALGRDADRAAGVTSTTITGSGMTDEGLPPHH